MKNPQKKTMKWFNFLALMIISTLGLFSEIRLKKSVDGPREKFSLQISENCAASAGKSCFAKAAEHAVRLGLSDKQAKAFINALIVTGSDFDKVTTEIRDRILTFAKSITLSDRNKHFKANNIELAKSLANEGKSQFWDFTGVKKSKQVSEEIETLALIKGMIKKHSDNKDYYFYKHSEDIGFTTKAAKTKWVAVELSSNTAHGYPFPESDVPKNIVEYFK